MCMEFVFAKYILQYHRVWSKLAESVDAKLAGADIRLQSYIQDSAIVVVYAYKPVLFENCN